MKSIEKIAKGIITKKFTIYYSACLFSVTQSQLVDVELDAGQLHEGVIGMESHIWRVPGLALMLCLCLEIHNRF